MNCLQITRELSVPTGSITAAVVADHVSACPDCAAWAERLAQFQQVWTLTRPADPRPAVFDRVWSRSMSAARSQSPAPPTNFSFTARRWATALLAVAAAFVIGWFGLKPLVIRDAGPSRGFQPIPGAIVQISLPPVDVPSGETVFIHIGGKAATTQTQPLAEISDNDTVAVEHDILNYMESLSSL